MKKVIIFLVSLALIISFAALVYYGLRHSRGVPVQLEEAKRVILEVPFLDKEIDLSTGVFSEIWEALPEKEVKLMYQVMVLPWPKSTTPAISLKAFRNRKDIYFYLSWKDSTEDRVLGLNKFSDACAVMFPLGKEVPPSSIMMGFIGKANIWQWKASQDREYWQNKQPQLEAYSDYYYPFEEKETLVIAKDIPRSAVNDLLAIRVGTITPKEAQDVVGRGSYQDGVWRVVFQRALPAVNPDEDAVFEDTKGKLCAFSVWNGSKGERGGRKSISDWVELFIKCSIT